MRIFVSGKINDNPTYLKDFREAGHHLYTLGHTPVLPIDLPEGLTDSEYFMIDHYLITICDAIYMLPNWRTSKGASIEFEIAIRDGKKIFYQGNETSERELEELGIKED